MIKQKNAEKIINNIGKISKILKSCEELAPKSPRYLELLMDIHTANAYFLMGFMEMYKAIKEAN